MCKTHRGFHPSARYELAKWRESRRQPDAPAQSKRSPHCASGPLAPRGMSGERARERGHPARHAQRSHSAINILIVPPPQPSSSAPRGSARAAASPMHPLNPSDPRTAPPVPSPREERAGRGLGRGATQPVMPNAPIPQSTVRGLGRGGKLFSGPVLTLLLGYFVVQTRFSHRNFRPFVICHLSFFRH